MEEHRRNGWYWLGAAPMTAGAALAVGWLISVDSAHPPRPQFWGAPAYIAIGLIAVGFLVIMAVMNDWPPFGRQPKAISRPAPTPRSPRAAGRPKMVLDAAVESEQGRARRAMATLDAPAKSSREPYKSPGVTWGGASVWAGPPTGPPDQVTHWEVSADEDPEPPEPSLRFGAGAPSWKLAVPTESDREIATLDGRQIAQVRHLTVRVDNQSLIEADAVRCRLRSVDPPQPELELPLDLMWVGGGGGRLVTILADGHESAIVTLQVLYTAGDARGVGAQPTKSGHPRTATLEIWRKGQIHDSATIAITPLGT